MLWHLTYSELYFTDTLWPDFDRIALEKAIQFYANRKRRFGLLEDQVSAKQEIVKEIAIE